MFEHKGTELHSPIIWAETELCTPRFTHILGIIQKPFPALSTLDPESLYIKWPGNCTWTQQICNFRKDNKKTNPEVHWIFRTKWRIRKSPNLIHSWILQDWLWTCKAAKVSCTRFCSKPTELHSPTLRAESKPRLFSLKVQCWMLHKHLRDHSETIFCTQHTWSRIAVKSVHFNTAGPQFQETQQKDKTRTALNIQTKTMN